MYMQVMLRVTTRSLASSHAICSWQSGTTRSSTSFSLVSPLPRSVVYYFFFKLSLLSDEQISLEYYASLFKVARIFLSKILENKFSDTVGILFSFYLLCWEKQTHCDMRDVLSDYKSLITECEECSREWLLHMGRAVAQSPMWLHF